MSTQLDWQEVGARIRRLRLERGLSQAELAAPDFTAAYISHLEKARRAPSTNVIGHIAERLGVNVDHLLTGRDPDLDLRLRMAVDQAVARIHSGHLDDARDDLVKLRRRVRRVGIAELEARVEEALALVAQREGRWEDAFAGLNAAEALLEGAPPEERTPVITQRARCHFATGDTARAIHILERHLLELTTDDDVGDPTSLLQTYSALVGPYFEAGLRDRAAEVAEAGQRLIAVVEDPEHVACLHINRAQILLDKGRSAEAMRALRKAEELFSQIGWQDSATKAAVALATAAVETGDLDRGEKVIRQTLEGLADSPSVVDKARSLGLLARIARLRGDPRGALEHLKAIDELTGVPQYERGWALREAGMCHSALGDHKQARRDLEEALRLYGGAEARTAVATTAALLGDVLTELGKHKEALQVYRNGLSAVEDLV